MDWSLTPTQARFLAELRAFLDTAIDRPFSARPYGASEEAEWERARALHRALAARGRYAPAFPRELGGADLGPIETALVDAELAARRVPDVGRIPAVGYFGPTIQRWGTPAQIARHVGAIGRAEVVWCQGFSEPAAGSDLAALQARAVRDGDGWRINGRKVWTSDALHAGWCYLLARTDPQAPRHRGVSAFLVPMDAPGIEVRPLVNVADAPAFAEVTFDDVFAPADALLGEAGRGWYVATTTLDLERVSLSRWAAVLRDLEDAATWLRHRPIGRGRTTDRLALADAFISANVARVLAARVNDRHARGELVGSEASVAKLLSSELGQRVAHLLAGLGGLPALAHADGAPVPGTGEAVTSTVPWTIAGGTSEVQRNIIAQRGIGLPRS